jgi:GT2 family glycosyltransferase
LPNAAKNLISQALMLLSIIIVNYNVKHFLEQCLCSVQLAMQGMEVEVFVVDNNSSDGSVEYLSPRFGWVKFIANKQNPGFGKANNQAVALAKGKYVLFLNPDTLLPADCLRLCVDFMDANVVIGGLGIQMLDGAGHFLPESKRAFPSPLTSLFKLSGMSALFPKSKLFARYHLGNLSQFENHEVDVLAGAFMLVSKQIIDQHGAFDEAFFMYGEDVDLSYRIQKAGWKNYYFSDSSIIHFKGESTKKGSLNYVRMFYQAMSLFVKKHYGGSRAKFFNLFIQIAIWLRAGITALSHFLKRAGLPFFDMLISMASLTAAAGFWQGFVKTDLIYADNIFTVTLPLFSVSFILTAGVAGLYDKWYRPRSAWLAMMAGLLINLAIYSLLNVDYRFSRGVILFGGILTILAVLLFRRILQFGGVLEMANESKEHKQTIVVGSESDYVAAMSILELAGRNERVLGRIGVLDNEPQAAGSFNRIKEALSTIPAKEIIFCLSSRFTLAQAIQFMQQEKRKFRYKFFYVGSGSMVGSDSKETSGDAVGMTETFTIDLPAGRRMKKVNDIIWCVGLLLLLPVHLLFIKNKLGLISNIFNVLIGKKTWVGYCAATPQLPKILPAVIGSNGQPLSMGKTLIPNSLQVIDYWYAKDYEWGDDTKILLKAYRNLGS